MAELKKGAQLVVYIPDTRGVVLSRYGKGNLKIGAGVYTYSRLPGRPNRLALGSHGFEPVPTDEFNEVRDAEWLKQNWTGTCPGSTPECERICYAARPVKEMGPVAVMWLKNSIMVDVPPLPEDAKLLRIHVSGDFDTVEYVENWIVRLTERPDVRAWAYTRSWRVPELLPALERLRALPNVQLFASMDKSTPVLPPAGWRRAWIDGDPRAGDPQLVRAHMDDPVQHNLVTVDGGRTYVCPEETKRVPDCERCGYCIDGTRNDVTFLEH